MTLASEYKSHSAQLDFSKPTNNLSLSARISPDANTNKQTKKNYYPTREHLVVVMNWMQQLYPHKSYTTSNQKTAQYKQISQTSPTVAAPSVIEQKYVTIDTIDLENRLFVHQQSPEWDTKKTVLLFRQFSQRSFRNI